jgi:exopolysaccharide transport family protein
VTGREILKMNYAPWRTLPLDPKSGSKAPGVDIDLRELTRTLLRRKWLIVMTAVVPAALVAGALQFLEPRFTAESLVVMNIRQPQVLHLEAVVPAVKPNVPVVGSEVDVVSSPAIIGKVIDRLGLAHDPEFNPALNKEGRHRFWSPADLLRRLKSLASLSSGPEPEADLVRTRIIEAVGSRLSIRNDNKTYTIRVGFTSQDPQRAALIANTFADIYVQDQLAKKFDMIERTDAWLTSRLATLYDEVRLKDQAAQTFREKENLIETGGATIIMQQLTELNSQLVIVRETTAEAEARLKSAQETIRSKGNIDGVSEVVRSPLIQRLREQETAVRRREAELANRYGPRYPDVINTRAEREALGRKIDEEIGRIIAGLANDASVARARQKSLETTIGELEKRIAEQNRAEIQLAQLKREADAARKLYETLLERSKEISGQQGLQGADARIASAAEVPTRPSFPQPKLMLIAALAVGGGLGILLALVVERLDRGFRTAAQLHRLSDYPVLGILPRIKRSAKWKNSAMTPEDYVLERPNSSFDEALRRIVAGLGAAAHAHQSVKVLMIASSVPGEGKTSFCLALARQMAAARRKVLLIDADLRRPRIGRALGSSNTPGLVDILRDEMAFNDVVREDVRSGAHFITAGSSEDNSRDLLEKRTMDRLIHLAAGSYDLVLIDTPPVMAVSDTAALARLVDGCLFLVQWSSTPREVAVSSLHQLAENGAPILGTALVQVDMKKYPKYSSGDYALYGRRYRQYYSN